MNDPRAAPYARLLLLGERTFCRGINNAFLENSALPRREQRPTEPSSYCWAGATGGASPRLATNSVGGKSPT